jgi:hypothetical protein
VWVVDGMLLIERFIGSELQAKSVIQLIKLVDVSFSDVRSVCKWQRKTCCHTSESLELKEKVFHGISGSSGLKLGF